MPGLVRIFTGVTNPPMNPNPVSGSYWCPTTILDFNHHIPDLRVHRTLTVVTREPRPTDDLQPGHFRLSVKAHYLYIKMLYRAIDLRSVFWLIDVYIIIPENMDYHSIFPQVNEEGVLTVYGVVNGTTVPIWDNGPKVRPPGLNFL